MTKDVNKKLKKIRLIVSDVDGVLTDGRIYIAPDGKEMKVFHSRDSYRMETIIRSGIPIILFTGRKSEALMQRSREIEGVRLLFKQDTKNSLFDLLENDYGVKPREVLYIGDDWNDLNLMTKVGISVSPADGTKENRKIADIVTKSFGGHGVISEVVEIVMKARGTWNKYAGDYLKKFIL
jgi:3-deoxy-D-manno-octulosonate 8-phosphate phosphatase (KDO 8-P phosphatase)